MLEVKDGGDSITGPMLWEHKVKTGWTISTVRLQGYKTTPRPGMFSQLTTATAEVVSNTFLWLSLEILSLYFK